MIFSLDFHSWTSITESFVSSQMLDTMASVSTEGRNNQNRVSSWLVGRWLGMERNLLSLHTYYTTSFFFLTLLLVWLLITISLSICTNFVCFQNKETKWVDLGGAYIGPTQNRILRIAKQYGVKTYKVNEEESLIHYVKVSLSEGVLHM